MKEVRFEKIEADVIKECLQEKIDTLDLRLLGNRGIKKAYEKIIGKLERAEKTIKVSSRKGKGRALQYWVCERIADIFGLQFVQSDDECLVHSREMGQHGTDIVLRGNLYKQFPYDVECKSCETLSIPEWVRQARTNNKKEGRNWLVVFKKQTIGGEPLVLMDWSCFEELFRKTK